ARTGRPPDRPGTPRRARCAPPTAAAGRPAPAPPWSCRRRWGRAARPPLRPPRSASGPAGTGRGPPPGGRPGPRAGAAVPRPAPVPVPGPRPGVAAVGPAACRRRVRVGPLEYRAPRAAGDCAVLGRLHRPAVGTPPARGPAADGQGGRLG